MKNTEVAVLAMRLQQRETGAFDALYKQLRDTVYGLTYGKLRNAEDAEDATQDVFMNILEEIDSLRNPSAFNTWMYHFIQRACEKRYRQYRRRYNESFDFDSVYENNTDYLPDEWLEREEMRISISQLIDRLPENHREIIYLRYYDGFPPNEMCVSPDAKCVKCTGVSAKAKMNC